MSSSFTDSSTNNKYLVNNKELWKWIALVDLEKAFDRVLSKVVW